MLRSAETLQLVDDVVDEVVALSSTLQPATVTHVDSTAEDVVTVAVCDKETSKDVVVAQSSAVSVSQPPSGPVGLAGKVGMRSGPMVYLGQEGSGPIVRN